MAWDNLEGAAFLYYCSRGMALGLGSRGDALGLVARFMRDKCIKTEEPRPIEDLKSVFEKNANFRNETGWDVPRTNRLILKMIATKKITWKRFLAMLEFNLADKALLKDYGLLDIVEQIQRTQDPLVTNAQQDRDNKSPFRPGGLTSLETSLPETYNSLPAPTSMLGSDYGSEYSRSTEATRRIGGVYGDSPYLPLERGPVPSASSSTKYYGAGAAHSSLSHAFQGSGYSAPHTTTGHLPQPLPREYPSAADSGQQTSDLQAQYPLPAGQLWTTPTAYKRPATEAVEEQEISRRKRRPDLDHTAIQKENVAKNIAKAELREQQRAKAQRKEADKPRLAAEREIRDTEKKEKAARDKVENDAQNQARREKAAKERLDKKAARDREQRDLKEERDNKTTG